MQSEPTSTPLQKTAREKIGWRYMIAGFILIILAAVTLYLAQRSPDPTIYESVGRYLIAAGLIVYVVGRILRWRGRAQRPQI